MGNCAFVVGVAVGEIIVAAVVVLTIAESCKACGALICLDLDVCRFQDRTLLSIVEIGYNNMSLVILSVVLDVVGVWMSNISSSFRCCVNVCL